MSVKKKCIFIPDRDCPFNAAQVPFETCQVCIEAWKTELELRKKEFNGDQSSDEVQQSISIPVLKERKLAYLNERLNEIDERLKRDEIDPLEYIRLRKEQINSVIEGNTSTDAEKPPQLRKLRVAIVTKSLFRKQVKTYPEDWELPQEVSGKVIDLIYEMAEEKAAEDIKLRSGAYKIACIAAEKNQLALLILDADEEFESYLDEMKRINLILRSEKSWNNALKKLE